MSDYEDDDYGSDFESAAGNTPRDEPQASHHVVRASDPPTATNEESPSRQEEVESTPPAAKPTAEQQQMIDELKRQNEDLRKQLLQLNHELDQQLTSRGQKVTRIQPIKRKKTPLEKLEAQNEAKRKMNSELSEKVNQPHNFLRHQELMNEVGSHSREVEKLRGENKSLENIYANQMIKIQVADKVDDEMREERGQHQNMLAGIKQQIRAQKERREKESAVYNQLLRQEERLAQKIKVQDSIGETIKSLADVQQQVDEKEMIIESYKYQVAVLSKTNTSDKRRVKNRGTKFARELQDLREEANLLKERLATGGMAQELGIRQDY